MAYWKSDQTRHARRKKPTDANPFVTEKKVRYQTEAGYARTFEALLDLHGLEFWHVNLPMRSKAGFPDYVIFGDGWMSFVELKARSPWTNRKGRLSAEQRTFHERIERAGGEVRTFTLPDQWDDVDQYLNARTGKGIWGAYVNLQDAS